MVMVSSLVVVVIVLLLMPLVCHSIVSKDDIIDSSSSVSLVITSCDRTEFLGSLLLSMFTHNKYKFNEVIIAEASGKNDVLNGLKSTYPFLTYLVSERLSQVVNIDIAYDHVKKSNSNGNGNGNVKYILHFEEDWIILRGGFIEKSISLLELNRNISVVSLHAPQPGDWFRQIDPCCNFSSIGGYMKIDTDLGWGYFTWGAGLRRLQDYIDIGGNYRQYNHTWKTNAQLQNEAKGLGIYVKKNYIHREWKVNWLYKDRHMRVALINDTVPYARHVGAKTIDQRGYSPFE